MEEVQLSDRIEDLCQDDIYVWYNAGVVSLDGNFTPQELLNIVELLQVERPELF